LLEALDHFYLRRKVEEQKKNVPSNIKGKYLLQYTAKEVQAQGTLLKAFCALHVREFTSKAL
jgi:hypothetical protein